MITLQDRGIKITLDYDGDGFPFININTGGDFEKLIARPTVDVHLNGVQIHKLFNDGDLRWKE